MLWVGVILFLVGLVTIAVTLAFPTLGTKRRGLLPTSAARHGALQKQQRNYLERIRWMMWQAGWERSPKGFVALQAVGGLLFFFGGLLAGGLGGAILGAATAFAVPYTVLEMARTNKMSAYNAAFPTTLSVLLEHLRHQGANLPAALQATAATADETFRKDLLEIAAAFSAGAVDLERLQALINRRASPFLQRLVSVLVARKDNLNLLLEDLSVMLMETQQDAALMAKIKSALQMPMLTLVFVGLGAPLMFVAMLFMFPSLQTFYVVTPTGNLLGAGAMVAMLGATAWAYYNMQKQTQLLEPQFLVPESRPESAFFDDQALAGGEARGEGGAL